MNHKKNDIIIPSPDSPIYTIALANAANKLQLQSDLIFDEFFSQHTMPGGVAMSFVFDLLINIVQSSLIQAIAVTNCKNVKLENIASDFGAHLSSAIEETLKRQPDILKKFNRSNSSDMH